MAMIWPQLPTTPPPPQRPAPLFLSDPAGPAAFTTAEALAQGLPERALARLLRDGAVERLGRGAWRRADAPPPALDLGLDLLEVALRAPEATLCLGAALAHHGLSDHLPAAHDLALPRDRRPPRVAAPVRWHRFDGPTFHLGRGPLEVDAGRQIGLYSPERCLADAFRLRHTVGEDVAVEALKRWLRRPTSTPAALLALARALPKAEPALAAALRVLL
jgi:hypothetical protein